MLEKDETKCEFGEHLKEIYEQERDCLRSKIEEIKQNIEELTKETHGLKKFDREILQKFNDMMSMIIQIQNQVMELSKHIDNGWKQDLLDKLSNMVIDMAKTQSKFNHKMVSSKETNDYNMGMVKEENMTKLKLKKWELLLAIFGSTGLIAMAAKLIVETFFY